MTRGCHFCVQMQKGTRQREVMKECLCVVGTHTRENESRGRKNLPRPSYLIPGNRPLFPFRLCLCLLPSSYGRLYRPTLQSRRIGLIFCGGVFYADLTKTVKFTVLQHADGYLLCLRYWRRIDTDRHFFAKVCYHFYDICAHTISSNMPQNQVASCNMAFPFLLTP